MTHVALRFLLLVNSVYLVHSYAEVIQNPKFHVDTPSSTIKPTERPRKDDCFVRENEVVKGLPPGHNGRPPYDISGKNCSGFHEVEITKTEISEIEQWKTQVVIACTITAAVEIFIVVIIVLYWKQIRWSLRKLQCPCGESSRRHRAQLRERRRRERLQQRRLRHLVVTTTQNAITATTQTTTRHEPMTSDSSTSQYDGQSGSLSLHKNLHILNVPRIKQTKSSNSNKTRQSNRDRDKLENKPPDMQAMHNLKTDVDKKSINSADSDKSLIEESEPVPSTSYGYCTSGAQRWSRDRHYVPVRALDTESDSDLDYSELTTVQVHR